jgi:hypothetical protein
LQQLFNYGEIAMYKFNVWIRLNPYQTANVIIHASHGYEAKMLAEAQYGAGNVLNYTQIND